MYVLRLAVPMTVVVALAVGCGDTHRGSDKSADPTATARGRYSFDERFYATVALDFARVVGETDTRTARVMGAVSQGSASLDELEQALIASETSQARAWRRLPVHPPDMYLTAHRMFAEARATHESATREFLLFFADKEPAHIVVGNEGLKRSGALVTEGVSVLGQSAGVR